MDIKILYKLLFNFNILNILEKNDFKIILFVVIDKICDLYICNWNELNYF